MQVRNILIFCATAALAGAAVIQVGPNIHVSGARSGYAHNEVVLAADPNHPGRLLACSMFGAGEQRSVKTASYVSFDNGKTWSPGAVADEHFADDPTCAYGPDGAAYMITKTNLGPPKIPFASDADFISIRRSQTGGKTWEPVIRGPQTNDRPFMAVDMTKGPFAGRIYVDYEGHVHGETDGHSNDEFKHAFKLVYSKDGGRTFSAPVVRALMDQAGSEGANLNSCPMAVLSDGTLVALFAHQVTAPGTGKSFVKRSWIGVYRSTDGGESLEPAIKIGDIGTAYNSTATRTVTASLAADASASKYRDRVYVTRPDTHSGRAQILCAFSADKGKTWSAPKVVNDDQPTAGRPGPDDFMATPWVNRDGIAGILWYDRRDSPDNIGYYARFSASLDGGETWLPSVRVSEAPNANASLGDGKPKPVGTFSSTGGHTAGLDSDSSGAFHALWIDNRTGIQQVWTATITVRQ